MNCVSRPRYKLSRHFNLVARTVLAVDTCKPANLVTVLVSHALFAWLLLPLASPAIANGDPAPASAMQEQGAALDAASQSGADLTEAANKAHRESVNENIKREDIEDRGSDRAWDRQREVATEAENASDNARDAARLPRSRSHTS